MIELEPSTWNPFRVAGAQAPLLTDFLFAALHWERRLWLRGAAQNGKLLSEFPYVPHLG